MRFHPTSIAGVVLVELERHGDERGWFARTFCAEQFADAGLPTSFVQANASFTGPAGTVRGLHYQLPPSAEDKYVRCVRGGLFDVGLDLRAGSSTFGQHVGVELTPENGLGLLIPKGVAHGFQTLVDDTEVSYLMSEAYALEHERGIRFDDPDLGIAWPLPVAVLSEKDRGWPSLSPGLAIDLGSVAPG